MSKLLLPNSNFDTIHKFGQNPDVDSAEDIWSGGGDYPFPTSATTTLIASTSANDTSDGTHARTVAVFGLDTNLSLINEIVTLDGQSNATLANQYLRVFRASVETSGDPDNTNEGDIDIKHGATVLARIPAGIGQTLMAIYTVSTDYASGVIARVFLEVIANANQNIDYAILVRPQDGAWETEDIGTVFGTVSLQKQFLAGINIRAGSDIRLRVTRASTTNMSVVGGFDMLLMLEDTPSGSF